ncbi:MAG: hypothetical protein ABIK23_01665 [candidate division WOR-3 bacterium]
MITKTTCARFLMVITFTVLICALISSCATVDAKENRGTTALDNPPDSVKLKGTFTITNDGLTVNFYDEKDNLRATIEIDSAHIGLAFKPESLNIPLGEDERAPKGSLIITKDRFALSLYDEKTKGTAFLTLTSDGLQLVVYDSLGKPVWGK